MVSLLRIKQILKHSKLIKWIWGIVHRPEKMKYLSYGDENPDKVFYIIGRDNMIAGAWSLINTVLMHLCFAEEHGYIPVIDMMNYKNQYTLESDFGRINFWEKVFIQPAGYSLEDISKSRNIIKCSSELCPDIKYNTSDGSNIWEDKEKIDLFRRVYKKYIIYNDRTQRYLDSQVEKYLGNAKNVIGVLCRGTDFLVNKPTGHEVQPDPEVVLNDVRNEFAKGGYDSVFLATEDQDIQDLFYNEFKDRLLFVDQVRIRKTEMKGDAWLSNVKKTLRPDEDKEMSFISYFTATYILSKCRCIFAGRNNGSKGLLYLPSNFSFVKIYNLGQY